MTPERWSRVKDLYGAVLELDPSRRNDYLAQHCGDDPSLREEIERLLRAGDQASQFLEAPPVRLASLLQQLSEKTQTFAEGHVVSGRFRIIRLLGRGGMGEVYRAEDLTLGGEVAIKAIRPEIASDLEVLLRFRREILAGRAVTHPNVCRLFDIASVPSAGGATVTYLTMEMLQGETMDAFMRRAAPVSAVRALALGLQIASALDAAHRAGIVHRDLKPTNVMLVEQQAAANPVRVVVTDFGLSRFLEPRSDLEVPTTLSARLIGTPDYMAPEQLDGGTIAPPVDVFAFGLLMYELLTGAFPFKRVSNFSAALERLSTGPVPPATHVPSLPLAWQNLLLKCLSRSSSERFQNGGELVAELSNIAGRSATQETARSSPQPRRRTRFRYLAAGAAGFGVLAALLAFAGTGLMRRWIPDASKSIAVLPFQNHIGDRQMDYLSHGITETLIQDLSRIPPHRVLSLAAVARYDKPATDPIQAGRELHVDRVLSGSVSRLDGELLIDAELSDVPTGKQVWGHSYRRKVTSLSTTLEEFSTEVTDGLRLHLSGPLKERLDRQYAVGSDSYRDYLKARFEMSKRTPVGLDAAMRLFDEVIARDPSYAPAWAAQARVYNLMAFFGARGAGQEPLEALRRSQAAAAHALDLDSTLAEAWSSLAYVQMQADYQWTEAESNFHRSIELDPTLADSHDAYGYELTALGRFDEAIREIKIAESLAPGSLVYPAARAVFLHHARRYQEGLDLLLPIQGRFSDHSTIAYLLARDYWGMSKPAEALALLGQDPPADPLDRRIPLVVVALAKAGDLGKARELRAQYVPRAGTSSWYYLALADIALGQSGAAIEDLEKAWQQRADAVMLLGVDPLVDPLRGDPRFQSLLGRINLKTPTTR